MYWLASILFRCAKHSHPKTIVRNKQTTQSSLRYSGIQYMATYYTLMRIMCSQLLLDGFIPILFVLATFFRIERLLRHPLARFVASL